MTDHELIAHLRNSKGWPGLGNNAADRIEYLAARLETAEAAANNLTTLHIVISAIREKSGVGCKPMLAELADAIAARIDGLVTERDDAESREKIAADVAVGYLSRAEAAEAKMVEGE